MHLLIKAALLGLALLLAAISPAGVALAQPKTPIYCPLPEDGIWVDKKAKMQELTRLEVESRCIDGRVEIRARAFMRCDPRDCKWGWTQAELREGSGVRVRLSGFFGARIIEMRAFGDKIETYVTAMPYDAMKQEVVTSHILTRAKR